jgi:hypothetical protein
MPPIPNRRVRRVNGWISLRTTFVAMKENPQKIIAHKAGQDKEPPLSSSDALFYHK